MTTKKSVKKNAFLNIVRIIVTTIFPLITFPYATRVLGVDNMGKVQFGLSIVSYCSLLAMLGVKSYGIREGASCREDRKKISKLASEIFTINMITTILSYALLIGLLLLPTDLAGYRELILLQSIVLLFNVLGVDWVYGAYEDYLYITIRAFAVNSLSLVLMFLFVKQPDDYYKYAFITVLASAGANVFNFFHARKYCDLRLTKHPNFKMHLKPLLVLFSSALAVQIYINSDIVMLGLMSGDKSVGIYSVAVKVYTIIKNLLNAVVAVAIPRLAYYLMNKKTRQYYELGQKVINGCIVLIVPAILGLALMSGTVVSIISGPEYSAAAVPLRILSLALLFAVASNFFGNAILVTQHKEKSFLIATVAGAFANVVLNFVLIPILGENGAALTTVISEIIVMAICMISARGMYKLGNILKNSLQVSLGCVGIILIWWLVSLTNVGVALNAIMTVSGSVITYAVIIILLRNEVAMEMMRFFINKAKRLKNT